MAELQTAQDEFKRQRDLLNRKSISQQAYDRAVLLGRAARLLYGPPNLEWDERAPMLHLSMDTERLQRMGLTPREVTRQLQFLLNGEPVAEVHQDIRTVQGFRNCSPS